MQKLLSQCKFAKLAGVNASTVTRLKKTVLKHAVCGKQIDAAHPDAVAYLKNREREATPPPAEGIDPLYEEGLAWCRGNGRWTATNLQRGLRIGYTRACRMLALYEQQGLVPAKESPTEIRIDRDEGTIKVGDLEPAKPRGGAAEKATKKSAALAKAAAPEEPKDDDHPMSAYFDYTVRDILNKFGTDVAWVDFLKAAKTIQDIEEKELKNATTRGELISRDVVKKGVLDPLDSAFRRMLSDGSKTIAVRAKNAAETGQSTQDIERIVEKSLTSFINPVKAKLQRTIRNA